MRSIAAFTLSISFCCAAYSAVVRDVSFWVACNAANCFSRSARERVVSSIASPPAPISSSIVPPKVLNFLSISTMPSSRACVAALNLSSLATTGLFLPRASASRCWAPILVKISTAFFSTSVNDFTSMICKFLPLAVACWIAGPRPSNA